ncbi:MAG TPA: 6-phosphogluconolactonase [Planctomycetota bacterium]
MTSARAGAGEVVALADPAALAAEAERRVLAAAAEALAARGRFSLALAGGSTPRAAYARLATAATDWTRWHVFLGDERVVPPDHADSNEGMARAAWLGRVPARLHRVRTELGVEAAAADYEAELRRAFDLGPGEVPVLDLVLLGLGPDGHTASLFPGSPAVRERERLVAPVLDAPKPPPQRVTLTFPVLEAARTVLVLVAGADKAAALAAALDEREPEHELVARRLRHARGALAWLADRAALGQ